MKKILLLYFSIFIFQNLQAQDKKVRPFFTGSFKLTFAVNENFVLFDDDGETFLIPSGTFFRFGFGYEFGRKFSVSLNGGYDHHFPFSINAFPAYVTARYNIWGDVEDSFFVEYSQGRLWQPSSRFSDGDYSNIALGWQLYSDTRWKPIVRLTFHRKEILGFEDSGNLDSISLGVGFRFF